MSLFPSRAVLAGLLLAFVPLIASAADAPKTDAPKVDDAERARIESMVHDYLMKHPEVILEAVQALQDKEKADKDKVAQEAIVKHASELLRDPHSQIVGNLKGDCVMVEFFDNQCPFCKANEPEIQKLLKDDNRVKLILKEFPILGPASLTAAKAALASVKQGKYGVFHEALLAHKGAESEDAVDEVGKSIGLNLDKLHKDMQAADIDEEINGNLELARTLNITGTPGFIIGNQLVDGASNVDELKKFILNACPKKS